MNRIYWAKNPYILAPMAGFTDKAFREVCAELGAGLTYTEMISAKGILYENKRTKELISISEAEGKAVLQLFGSEADIVAKAAQMMEEEFGDVICAIDINMGCPAPKITKNGEGSALMKDKKLAGEIISAVKKSVKLPVSAKFRSGVDKNNINAVEFAKELENAGADALCIHGRTADQFYSGKADMELAEKVVKAVNIPVIINGDIQSLEGADALMEKTGAAAAMIGRAAIGNPHIFMREKASDRRKIEMAIRQLELAMSYKGYIAIPEFRKHAAYYTKGIKGAGKIRNELMHMEDEKEIKKLLLSLDD